MTQHNEKTEIRTTIDRLSTLRADCESCFGLCCTALPFAASSDFAADKASGQPCSNLQADFRCGIHSKLREKGYRGCTVYDCFGAGQKISQATYRGNDWRKNPSTAAQMFDVFLIMQQLHELLWYLNEALTLSPARSIHQELSSALDETERLTRLEPESILELDMTAYRAEVNRLLLQTSGLVRADALSKLKSKPSHPKKIGRGAMLIGAKLKGADLRAANLRSACLIAADLRDADLRAADLIGADFRDTDLRGADLSESLFVTRFQINAAKGDARTKLPPTLSRPSHWM